VTKAVIICCIGSDSYLAFGSLAAARLRFSNIFGDFESSGGYSRFVSFGCDCESDSVDRDCIRKKQNSKAALRPVNAARLVYLGSS
jgi:hypothetical protein